ncbi:hypothetical protein AB0G00_05455 [Nocardia salmonicida]|uniref:hypothetical protein n=1 Tax=Nocardia salmonicida TaxID=53431 RepID=UPI0033EB0423
MSADAAESWGDMMGYPYGPQQGQGYPPVGQQGYNPYGQAAPGYGAAGPGVPGYGAPVPGYGAPGYGMPGPGAPGYGYPQLPATGGTAITAAVLALLLSLIGGAGLAIGYGILGDNSAGPLVQTSDGSFTRQSVPLSSLVMTYFAIGASVAALWFIGAILLFLRKSAGRVIIIILASLTALGGLVSLVFTLGSAVSSVAGVTIGLIQAGFATLILCLAAAGSTGRWIRAAQQRPSYPQGGYQQY